MVIRKIILWRIKMRLTEAISFLQENPTGDDIRKFTHIDIEYLKGQMLEDKEFGKFVRKHRKEFKKNE
jgi:hypothetical protein